MHIVLFLLFGLVVGVLERLAVPGREPGGWIVSILIGIGGAMLGGFLGRVMGLYRESGPAAFLMSFTGAIALATAYHAHSVRRRAA